VGTSAAALGFIPVIAMQARRMSASGQRPKLRYWREAASTHTAKANDRVGWKLAVWGACRNDAIAARSGHGPAYALRLGHGSAGSLRGAVEWKSLRSGRPYPPRLSTLMMAQTHRITTGRWSSSKF
jgi:hypothetical protein